MKLKFFFYNFIIILLLVSCKTKSFFFDKTQTAVSVDVLVKSTKSWDGKLLKKYSPGQPEISVLKIMIPAGAKLGFHKHPYINAGILMSGELKIFLKNGKRLNLKAGDSIIEVVDTWHYGENSGDKDAVIFVFYAGIMDKAVTQKKK